MGVTRWGLGVCLLCSTAIADTPRQDIDLAITSPRAATKADEARIDWARGLIIAGGIGLADRQAPNPAVARGTSRRRAEDAAKQLLAAALPSLPLASGGLLVEKLTDKQIAARVAHAVDLAITLDADPETDGSWHVTLGVPLEAVRQALAGARTLPAAGDAGPAVIIVDGVSASPALGYTVGGVPAGTLWVKDVPAWAKSALHIKARSVKAGAIEADAGKATEATLFVVITKG